MIDNSRVMERIAKLLAVRQERGASEQEAATAAEQVQRMLQEHNLTLSQVEEAGAPDGVTKRGKVKTERRAMYKYQRDLMAAIANSNFCIHQIIEVRTPRTHTDGPDRMSQQHLLVGREINTQASIMMYDYLTLAVRRAAKDAGYTEGKDGRYFMEGAVSRLDDRLRSRRREQEAASEAAAKPASGNGSHRELILADVYGSEHDQNNDTLNGWALGTTLANRLKAEKQTADRKKVEEELIAQGVDATTAFYRSYGYGEEESAVFAKNWKKKSRRRGGRGRSQGWTRGDEEHYRKTNSASYAAGKTAGSSIGLDAQVGKTERKRLT